MGEAEERSAPRHVDEDLTPTDWDALLQWSELGGHHAGDLDAVGEADPPVWGDAPAPPAPGQDENGPPPATDATGDFRPDQTGDLAGEEPEGADQTGDLEPPAAHEATGDLDAHEATGDLEPPPAHEATGDLEPPDLAPHQHPAAVYREAAPVSDTESTDPMAPAPAPKRPDPTGTINHTGDFDPWNLPAASGQPGTGSYGSSLWDQVAHEVNVKKDDTGAFESMDSLGPKDPRARAPGLQKRDDIPVDPAKAYLRHILGSTVGGCRLDEELGSGAMGTVYRATHLSLDKPVAVKILNPALFFEKKHVDSFFSEARAAASIEHQNILTIHNVGAERGLMFMVMQLVEGESLADRIVREVKLTPEETARIGIEAARGLRVAHEKGIIHRDIKPANLMLTWAGEVKIADFGLAKRTGKETDSDGGEIMGTPAYIPPEQIEARNVDHRADLYSLGVTLYYCATGKKPFEAAMVQQMLKMHLEDEAVPVHVMDATVPRTLSRIIEKLMRKSPADRHPDGDSLIEDLRAMMAELGADPDAPLRPASPPQPEPEPEAGKLRRFRSKLNDVFRPFRWTEGE